MIRRGWRLPSLWQGNGFVLSAPTSLRFSKPLVRGDMLLEICVARSLVGPKPSRMTDHMPTEPAQISSFTGSSGTKYGSRKPMLPTRVDGRPALTLQEPMIADRSDPVGFVRIDLVVHEDTRIAAFNRAGDAVADTLVTPAARADGISSATLQATEISRIIIQGTSRAAVVLLRWGADDQPLSNEIAEIATPDLPVVIGVTRDGKRVPLTPTIVPPVDIGANTCFKFDYALDDLGGGADDGWVAIEIPAHRRGEIALVSLCGVTVEAGLAQAMDGEFRASLVSLLGGLVGHLTTNEPTREIQLDPGTTYQVRATWTWQGFRPAQPGDEPSPPSSGGWLAGNTDRFTFRTAAFGPGALPLLASTASLASDPAQGGPGYDERTFDPRGLARYIMASTPDHQAPPHFLDDRVGFWFSVDHIPSLVDHYDRVPLVKVLRTDPAPGSLHNVPAPPSGGHHPLDVTIATRFAIEALTWFEADHRFVVAAEAAPCIDGTPPLGSSSVSVDADLKPRADYDLLMTVAPKTVGAHPEIVVARNHFRTSRYRNPSELLAALGFQNPIGLAQPFDAIASGALPPAGPPEIGDALLDALIKQIGLDPWPLPAGPRTSIVWARPVNPADPWRVAGALIEADEPVVRAGFATGAVGEAATTAAHRDRLADPPPHHRGVDPILPAARPAAAPAAHRHARHDDRHADRARAQRRRHARAVPQRHADRARPAGSLTICG